LTRTHGNFAAFAKKATHAHSLFQSSFVLVVRASELAAQDDEPTTRNAAPFIRGSNFPIGQLVDDADQRVFCALEVADQDTLHTEAERRVRLTREGVLHGTSFAWR
jgi:hypothetical protein